MTIDVLDPSVVGRPVGLQDAPIPHRIVVHDYAGHAFPVQLSRWLAKRGHEVLHLYCSDNDAPRGRLRMDAGDAPGFRVEPLSIGRTIGKYNLAKRWVLESVYARTLARRVATFAPTLVLSGNAPPAVQAGLARAMKRRRIPVVAWVQDIFSPGVRAITTGWPAPLRMMARALVERTEFGAMRDAAALVVISEDFVPVLAEYGLRHPACSVVENWAPLGEIDARTKVNAWSRRHGLDRRFVFLFSGTLGMKHNPEHLAALAEAFRDDPDVRVVVTSQGLGRAYLEQAKARRRIGNLVLLDYQPYEDLPEVLAAADVAVVLLEPFAGGLSVPSKVYSYFCAQRAILGAIPAANLARRLIEDQGAGLCVDPTDVDAFIAAARSLRRDEGFRADCARRQAEHARHAFDIDRIGRRFEQLHEQVARVRSR